MSSTIVRTQIMQTLADITSVPLFDYSDYTRNKDLPRTDNPWMIVQFDVSTESLRTIGKTLCWREDGAFYIHLIRPIGEASHLATEEGDRIRKLIRATRHGAVVIESVEPFSDATGVAIQLDGKWHGWSAPASYYFDNR